MKKVGRKMVSHAALFEMSLHLAFSRLEGELHIHAGERDENEMRYAGRSGGVNQTELPLVVNRPNCVALQSR